MSIDITIPGGESRRLLTAGKYCPDDIVVTAEGGGAYVPIEEKDVCFWDYDGTLLYSYTAEEAQALEEMPPLPIRPGLICQGWNYDLETIKGYNRKVYVGATYITDDGKTRIYVDLEEGRLSPRVGCSVNGYVEVDWGDGSEPDVLTSTDLSAVIYTPNHTYLSPGEYVITLDVHGTMHFRGSDTYFSRILTNQGNSETNRAYFGRVKKIEIGSGVEAIKNSSFRCCYHLENITIPREVIEVGNYAFRAAYRLKNIVLPDSITIIGEGTFYDCQSLKNVVLPDGLTSIGNSAFYSCMPLKNIVLPNDITSIGNNAFYSCQSLKSIVLPDGLTSIGNSAFYNCYCILSLCVPDRVTSIDSLAFARLASLSKLRFESILPPTVNASNAFNELPTDCVVEVPAESLDVYKNATNYGGIAARMVGV